MPGENSSMFGSGMNRMKKGASIFKDPANMAKTRAERHVKLLGKIFKDLQVD